MLSPLAHDDPRTLGGYRLVARLGSGGMGTVYLGRSPRGRTVALKTMHSDFAAQREFRARFQLEVDAARVIGGFHGAEVVDADVSAGTPWLATEYVLGPPLDAMVARCGPLPEDATRAVGSRLSEALAQLHASHVVHRDLKPSNILLTAAGPKVIDFGIARAAGEDRLTRTGAAAGTPPAFMSPEQATGQEHASAGDVFALAGVLVFASTGRGPFGTGQTADLLYRVRYGEPDLSEVPTGLVTLLAQCLSKNPAERPTTQDLAARLDGRAAEFADCLPDAVLADVLQRCGAVWEAPPPSLPDPEADLVAETRGSAHSRPTRRRALRLGGGAAVAAGVAVGAWSVFRAQETPEDPMPEALSPPRGSAPTAAPEPSWQQLFDGGELRPALAGEYVAVVAGDRLTTFDMQGEDAGTNRYVQEDEPTVADGEHLYGVSNKLLLCRVDPRTAEFGGPVADLNDLGLQNLQVHSGPILLGAGGSVLVVQGKPKSVPEDSLKRHVVALDTRTGKIKWRARSDFEATLVATVRGTLILVDALGNIWGLDVSTGDVTWSRKFDAALDKNMSAVGVNPDGYLYLGLEKVHALRVSDGKTVWRFGAGRPLEVSTDRKGHRGAKPYYGTPLHKDGTVYVLEPGNGVVALEADTGRLRWEMKAGWAAEVPPDAVPAAGDRYLYFPSDGPRLITAVDRKERAVKWVLTSDDQERLPRLLPHGDSRQLVVATDRRVFGLPAK
ncbi:serine/threonine-protein kinase [Streptomyces sp. GKU 257-1]|nr:serine/threonine-protein kinase [Streptomyces sp. GKU 257-1]